MAGLLPRGFSHFLCSTGWDTQCGDRVDSPDTPSSLSVLCGGSALRFPVPTASCQLTPVSPCGGAEGRGWAEPRVAPVRGSRLAPAAPPATSATEPLRRVGAARSHLPLIEFICYNPKQCKAGFSQAPAACLPIKIPSRTANSPSRLDIKQPVSKKRQEKSPCVRAGLLLPILLPQGRWPAGLPVPFRVAPGEISALQGDSKLISVASGQGRLSSSCPQAFSSRVFNPHWRGRIWPVTGIVTPAANLGIPKPAALLLSLMAFCLGCKSPLCDSAAWALRSWGHLVPGDHRGSGWAVEVHDVEQAAVPGVILFCMVLLWHCGASVCQPGWGHGS